MTGRLVVLPPMRHEQCPTCRGAGVVPAAAAPYLRPVHFLLTNLDAACGADREGDRYSAVPAEVTCAACVAAMVTDE
jgi:hypothetical protein